MTQEEKAKAYDEALALMQDCIPDDNGLVHVRPEEIFPELKEPEDERIRKALLEMVHDTEDVDLWIDYHVHKEEALAWLEKQGESYTKKDVHDAYIKGMTFAKDKLEKQNKQIPKTCEDEQKPTDSYCQANCKGYQEIGRCFADGECEAKKSQRMISAEAKEALYGKLAWSEEDEARLMKVIWYVDNPTSPVIKDTMLVEWLKQLKQRIGG